jgi:lipopolysaccharide transport protein LptA
MSAPRFYSGVYYLRGAIAALLVLSASAAAGEIAIDADSASYREDEAAVFSGNVRAAGDGISLFADMLEVGREDGAARYAANGKPAKINYQPEGGGDALEARAMRIIFSEKTRVMQLRGEVVVIRGELSAEGDEAEASEKRVVISGKPARLRWRGGDGEPIAASAASAEFLDDEQAVILRGDAKATSGESELAGEEIRYNLADGAFSVTAEEGGRVRATIKTEE